MLAAAVLALILQTHLAQVVQVAEQLAEQIQQQVQLQQQTQAVAVAAAAVSHQQVALQLAAMVVLELLL
jgi:hypothetical protein